MQNTDQILGDTDLSGYRLATPYESQQWADFRETYPGAVSVPVLIPGHGKSRRLYLPDND